MSNLYLFSDEAGDLDFSEKPNVSKYFIICTVLTDSLKIGSCLSDLRYSLIKDGQDLGDYFHATSDRQIVRDAVYEAILNHDFSIQAQICEKKKAYSNVRTSKARFYKYPWYYSVAHGLAKHIPKDCHLHATAASIGTKKERNTYITNLRDVINQSVGCGFSVDFRPAMADPCLQVADYCAWAIQRKWELGDSRSYDLIESRITYEYDLWSYKKIK